MQRAIRTCLMRGGSSKGIFVHSKDLPPAGLLRDTVLLRMFGSPDARQIDGLGGADVLTSKLAIVGPPSVPGADVDYTFGQVSFVNPQVDYKGNCGNLSSAVGPFAIDEKLVPIVPGQTSQLVRIHNTNTKAILRATVPLGLCGALVDGDTEISGVPGSGARIDLDFSATQGSVTGSLLPSGRRQEELRVEDALCGTEETNVTLLDAGQPTVFLHQSDLGFGGLAPRDVALALEQSPDLMRRIERIRGAAAVQMGMLHLWEDAQRLSPYTPFVVLVGTPPVDAPCDLDATCVFMQQVHKAYPVTGSVATTAAALLLGTLVHAAARPPVGPLRIRHPSGMMEVHGEMSDGAAPALKRAVIVRTARRLMDGNSYVPWSVWPADR